MDAQTVLIQLTALKQCIIMYELRGWTVSEDLKSLVNGMTLGDYMKICDRDTGRLFDGINTSSNLPVFLIFISTENNKKKDTLKVILEKTFTNFKQKYDLKMDDLLKRCHITAIFLDEIKKTDFEKFYEDIEENLEFFTVKHMSLDIMSYKYQPKFTFIKQYETSNDKYKKYGKICIDDPVVRYFYARPDDIFKVERRSHTGASTTYRIVKNIKMNEVKVKASTVNEKGVDTEGSMAI